MGKKNRDRRPARREPYKQSKPIILIVTEGGGNRAGVSERFRTCLPEFTRPDRSSGRGGCSEDNC